MPLPVGHALAGLAFQQARPGFFLRNRWLDAFCFMILANLPDADFLPGFILGRPNLFHHGASHSLGAALGVAGAGAALLRLAQGRTAASGRSRVPGQALMIFLVYCSHLLLDVFALDFVAPYGLPLFWPFSSRSIIASRPLFLNITRSPLAGDFLASIFNRHNLQAALREVVIIGGFVLLAAWWRRRPRSRGDAGGKTERGG